VNDTSDSKPRSNRAVRQAGLLLTSLALAAAVVLAFAVEPPAATVHRAVVVLDASPTSRSATRCDDAERIVRGLLGQPLGRLELLVMSTGDRASGGEPLVLRRAAREAPAGILEGTAAAAEHDAAVLASLRAACGTLPSRRESPILRAAAAAADTLRGMGCSGGGESCSLWLRTDGLEEEDPRVVRRLAGRVDAAVDSPAARIDNGDVSVTFCGLAEREVSGRRQLADRAAVAAAFGPEFTHPSAVRFLATCE
jgi:hypothetical protein